MNLRDEQILELAHSLLKQTLASRISWRRTDRSGRYLYVSETASVILQGPTGIISQAVGHHSLTIVDGGGNTIDTIETNASRSLMASATFDNPSQLDVLLVMQPVLQELFQEVERYMSRPNPTIGSLIREIDTQ